MGLHEFRNTLKKLRFIDRQDWMRDTFWRFFRNDPVRGFIDADEVEAEAIWDLIKPDESELDELRSCVVAFGAPSMVQWARDSGLPEGHLHPEHYDLLERCGARMVDFTRGEI